MSGSLSPFPLLLRCLVLMVPDSNQRLWELPLGPDLDVEDLPKLPRAVPLKAEAYSELFPTISNYPQLFFLSPTIFNNP